jgi:23S rRNA pseudouridine1911/1915/1917 synthase
MRCNARPSQNGAFIPVVFENSDLFVLNKPPGIPSIPLKSDETETAVGAALAYCPQIAKIGRRGLEPGILHRLDTLTSGLLVFSKTEMAFEKLHALWKSGGVRKYYRAIVSSETSNLPCPITISIALGHSKKSSKRMIPLGGRKKYPIRGKALPALTLVLSSQALDENVYDLELEIKTGVMHQIRCHLACQGWPILGDPLYRKNIKNVAVTHAPPRLFLHAWRLLLKLNSDQPPLHLEADLPRDWIRKPLTTPHTISTV